MRVVLRSLKSSFRHWNDDGNLRFIQRLPGFKWELTKRPQLINTDDDTDTHLHDKKKRNLYIPYSSTLWVWTWRCSLGRFRVGHPVLVGEPIGKWRLRWPGEPTATVTPIDAQFDAYGWGIRNPAQVQISKGLPSVCVWVLAASIVTFWESQPLGNHQKVQYQKVTFGKAPPMHGKRWQTYITCRTTQFSTTHPHNCTYNRCTAGNAPMFIRWYIIILFDPRVQETPKIKPKDR